jgi:hypothetical protein
MKPWAVIAALVVTGGALIWWLIYYYPLGDVFMVIGVAWIGAVLVRKTMKFSKLDRAMIVLAVVVVLGLLLLTLHSNSHLGLHPLPANYSVPAQVGSGQGAYPPPPYLPCKNGRAHYGPPPCTLPETALQSDPEWARKAEPAR